MSAYQNPNYPGYPRYIPPPHPAAPVVLGLQGGSGQRTYSHSLPPTQIQQEADYARSQDNIEQQRQLRVQQQNQLAQTRLQMEQRGGLTSRQYDLLQKHGGDMNAAKAEYDQQNANDGAIVPGVGIMPSPALPPASGGGMDIPHVDNVPVLPANAQMTPPPPLGTPPSALNMSVPSYPSYSPSASPPSPLLTLGGGYGGAPPILPGGVPGTPQQAVGANAGMPWNYTPPPPARQAAIQQGIGNIQQATAAGMPSTAFNQLQMARQAAMDQYRAQAEASANAARVKAHSDPASLQNKLDVAQVGAQTRTNTNAATNQTRTNIATDNNTTKAGIAAGNNAAKAATDKVKIDAYDARAALARSANLTAQQHKSIDAADAAELKDISSQYKALTNGPRPLPGSPELVDYNKQLSDLAGRQQAIYSEQRSRKGGSVPSTAVAGEGQAGQPQAGMPSEIDIQHTLKLHPEMTRDQLLQKLQQRASGNAARPTG